MDRLSPNERRDQIKQLNDDFRMSLVLSNTPHSPCLINGSFAAILPLNTSHIYAMTHELSQRALKNSLLPISTRRRLKNFAIHSPISKQMSIDGWMNNNEHQMKSSMSSTPSSLPISRQGSLDSRIEEILENNEFHSTSSNGHGEATIHSMKKH